MTSSVVVHHIRQARRDQRHKTAVEATLDAQLKAIGHDVTRIMEDLEIPSDLAKALEDAPPQITLAIASAPEINPRAHDRFDRLHGSADDAPNPAGSEAAPPGLPPKPRTYGQGQRPSLPGNVSRIGEPPSAWPPPGQQAPAQPGGMPVAPPPTPPWRDPALRDPNTTQYHGIPDLPLNPFPPALPPAQPTHHGSDALTPPPWAAYAPPGRDDQTFAPSAETTSGSLPTTESGEPGEGSTTTGHALIDEKRAEYSWEYHRKRQSDGDQAATEYWTMLYGENPTFLPYTLDELNALRG